MMQKGLEHGGFSKRQINSVGPAKLVEFNHGSDHILLFAFIWEDLLTTGIVENAFFRQTT
jgi:hypothetical protein